jgi:hypothetical protein
VILTSVAAGLVGAILSAALPRLLGRARDNVPLLLGIIKLPYLRTVAGGLCLLALANGISISENGKSHEPLTYGLWYGGAALLLIGVVVLTLIIDTRSSPAGRASGPTTTKLSELRSFAAAKAIEATQRKTAPKMPGRPAQSPPPVPPMPTKIADDLGRLYQEGRALRHAIKPDHATPMELLGAGLQMFKYPNVSAGRETQALRWNERVRNQLALHAQRFAPDWENAPALPQPQSPLLMTRITADGAALVTFLDARLGLLENIITEIRHSLNRSS